MSIKNKTKMNNNFCNIKIRPKFTPGNSKKLKKNPNRVTIEKMIEVQLDGLPSFKYYVGLKYFRKKLKQNKLEDIHASHIHYDWYMFPVEDGSQAKFNVLQNDVKELKKNSEWLSNYREAVKIVAKAWGWDTVNNVLIENKYSYWHIRLAKIIRSLWLFEQKDLMKSMQKFAKTVMPNGGLTYGNISLDEVYFMEIKKVMKKKD